MITNGKLTNSESVIAKLKRVIVQISIITFSLVSFIVLFVIPNEILTDDLKNQLLSISTGILTGSVLSLIYVVVEKKYDDNASDEAENRTLAEFRALSNRIHHTDNELISLFQMVSAHLPDNCVYCKFYIRSLPSRDDIKLEDAIKNASERIWFMTTNLFSHTVHLSRIEEAVSRGVDVKLLVLKPTSLFVLLRYKELEFESAKVFFDQMNVSIRDFVKRRDVIKKRNSDLRFEIKTHLHFPSCMLFIVDNKMYFNPILPYSYARNTTHICYDLENIDARRMAENFLRTFNECWETAEDAKHEYVFSETNMERL